MATVITIINYDCTVIMIVNYDRKTFIVQVDSNPSTEDHESTFLPACYHLVPLKDHASKNHENVL